jgi:hypothetical protein
MSQLGKNIIKMVALVFAAAVVIGITEVAVEAAPGDVRFTVNIPTAAQCSESTGSALAVVSGGKAGFPKIPVLLVTSCVSGTSVNLFLLDPFDLLIEGSTYNATIKKTFSTAFSTSTNRPDSGWEALALRADKGDLLACGTNSAGTVFWSVDFSPFNSLADGTATFVGPGPSGSSCNAIAWDATDKTIFQTPAVGPNVCNGLEESTCNAFHFMFTGTGTRTDLTPIQSGCTTPISGLGIAGTSLFVGCEADFESETASTVRQADKANSNANSNLVRAFSGPSDNPAGLPNDPTTLASQYKELLWSLDASSTRFLGVEIPGGTIGQLTGVPVLFPGVGSSPNACYNAQSDTPDTDGDGLLDCWENGTLWSDRQPGISYNGIYDGDIANRDVQLCVSTTECTDATQQKDLFVEIDYMQFHQPDPVAIAQVVQAFANAPTPPGPVRLHVQLNDQITHNNTTAFVPCTVSAATGEADFDLLKAQFFGTSAERGTVNGRNAKALAFRHGMFVHNLSPVGNTASGCSEIGGNDFVVSLGSWGSVLVNGVQHNAGTTDQQAGTLMHELGHTLGLRHGGGDNINCKPNYASVMNYTRQFSTPVTLRPLDYSRGAYGVSLSGGVIGLDKSNLNEAGGIAGGDALISGLKVAYGPPVLGKLAVANASTSTNPVTSLGISWNRDTDTADTGFSRDINQATNSSGGCPAGQKDAQGNVVQVLEGFNDWAHIQFNLRGSLDFGDGSRDGFEQKDVVDDSEITLDTAIALSRWVMDVKPNDPNNTIVRSVSQTVGVAIFSRLSDAGTEVELKADTIVPTSLTLRGTEGATWAVLVKTNTNGRPQCNVRDVDKDSLNDLVCDFNIPPNTISLGETKVVLDGTTPDGAVLSSDFIRVLP